MGYFLIPFKRNPDPKSPANWPIKLPFIPLKRKLGVVPLPFSEKKYPSSLNR